MKREKDWFPIILGILLGIMAALVLLACSHYPAYAEALPSPTVNTLIGLKGDIEISGAENGLEIAECLRVDLVKIERDGAWGNLTLPKVPPGVTQVLLYDGWHLLHGAWERTGDRTLRVHFRAEDLAKLDGTVGLYLVILAEQ